MVKIINGHKLAEKIKDEIVAEIKRLNPQEPICPTNRPNLAIILIGDREDSLLYIDLKESEAKKIGIDTHVYKCPKNITENEVYDMINCLNNDEQIDAILVQLPLPTGFDTDGIIQAISPEKDVDRFHPDNLSILLSTCDHAHVMPPVFSVILEILKSINYDLDKKQVSIIYNSNIFGKSLAKVLTCRGAKVSLCHPNDLKLKKISSQADILITAVGKKHFIKKDMIKKDAVVIDIGITKVGKKVYGDVDYEDVKNNAGHLTPVPGGVGPMTIDMLFKNTLELYKR
ncbi:MAG: bifunctional 5,10-methylenetetrahydrofolate dehydrogenase/5,10-methenyltetrahydrofolate cyclohydrolase, partial [Patescibacteria group bacterium]